MFLEGEKSDSILKKLDFVILSIIELQEIELLELYHRAEDHACTPSNSPRHLAN